MTYYLPTGLPTYSGTHPYWGAAACSWNFPLGTVLEFRDGRRVVCIDRGRLGSAGWVDVFVHSQEQGRHEITLRYGEFAEVRVVEEDYAPNVAVDEGYPCPEP